MLQLGTDATPRENVLEPRLSGWGVLSCFMVLLFFLGSPQLSAQNGPTNHLERAVTLITQGDLESAEKAAKLALDQPSTRALAYAVLGTIRLHQKRLDESSQYFEEATQLNPNLLGARLSLGQVYALQGKTDRARETFQQALKMDPDNPAPRMNLAQLEATAGNYRSSLELLEPIAGPLRGSPEGLLLLLVDNLGLGQKDAARALISDWMALAESVPPPLAIEFAKPLIEHGLAQEAIQALEKARGTGPAPFELAFALGGAYLANGDTARASEYYEQAASLNERCLSCFRQTASIARRRGNSEKELAYLIKAKRLDPENPDVLFEFGRVCLERDLFRDALPALEQAAELRPDNDRFTYVLASAYVGKLRYKEAIALLDRLVKKNPEDSVLHYALGSVLCTEGRNYPDAEKHLRKSISLQPDQLGAYYYLGLVLLRKGGQEQAAEIFQGVLKDHPNHIPSMEQLSIILMRKRKYDEAHQMLEKVLRLDPDSLTGHYQMSLLLGRLGQKEEADRHMQIAQRLEAEAKERQKTELYLLTPH